MGGPPEEINKLIYVRSSTFSAELATVILRKRKKKKYQHVKLIKSCFAENHINLNRDNVISSDKDQFYRKCNLIPYYLKKLLQQGKKELINDPIHRSKSNKPVLKSLIINMKYRRCKMHGQQYYC